MFIPACIYWIYECWMYIQRWFKMVATVNTELDVTPHNNFLVLILRVVKLQSCQQNTVSMFTYGNS